MSCEEIWPLRFFRFCCRRCWNQLFRLWIVFAPWFNLRSEFELFELMFVRSKCLWIQGGGGRTDGHCSVNRRAYSLEPAAIHVVFWSLGLRHAQLWRRNLCWELNGYRGWSSWRGRFGVA